MNCKYCGNELFEGEAFCRNCGAKADGAAMPFPPAPDPAPMYQPQAPAYQPPAPVQKALTLGTALLTIIIGKIPLIGIIYLAVTAFSGEASSKKNLSRALLLLRILKIIIITVFVIFNLGVIIAALSEVSGEFANEFSTFDFSGLSSAII